MAAFRRILAAIGFIELWVAVIAFTFVVILTTVQVGYRYLFSGSIWWGQEVSQLAMLVAYFLGISYVYKARQDIIITFLLRRLSTRTQVALAVFSQALTGAFSLFIVVTGIELAPSQLVFNTYILGIPRFYSTLPLIVASASMTLTALYYGIYIWQTRAVYSPQHLPYENAPEDLIVHGIGH
jgi:TRAP-type C4-dicarboxylate transport system permease small subunit